MIVLTLPVPPATNNLFINLRAGKGRARSQEYFAWQVLAGQHIQIARQKPVEGPVCVCIIAQENGRRDLDGYAKPLLDILVRHRLIPDDRNKIVRRIELGWSPDIEGVRITVVPCEVLRTEVA
jgi:Holliday junction resolvase RusA-like endonuclease